MLFNHLYKNTAVIAIAAFIVLGVGLSSTNQNHDTNVNAVAPTVYPSLLIDTGYTGTSDGTTAFTTSNTPSPATHTLLQTLNGYPSGATLVDSITSTSYVFPAGLTGAGSTGKLLVGDGVAGHAAALKFVFGISGKLQQPSVVNLVVAGADSGNVVTINSKAVTIINGTNAFAIATNKA